MANAFTWYDDDTIVYGVEVSTCSKFASSRFARRARGREASGRKASSSRMSKQTHRPRTETLNACHLNTRAVVKRPAGGHNTAPRALRKPFRRHMLSPS